MRSLVGLVCVSVCCIAAPALAQAPAVADPALPPPPPPSSSAVAPPSAEPPAAPLAPPPVASAPAPVAAPPPPLAEPPPPPPVDNDTRPTRERRKFYIAGELGWNGLSGLGVNFGYHPDPHFAIDTGAGLSITGLRVGARLRANLLTGEWTPFLGAGMSFAGGSGGQAIEQESKGEKAKYEVLASPFVQIAGGVNYTGTEGFMFTATTGYSILTRKQNTRFVSGSLASYEDIKPLYDGGLILSVAFGYAF